MNKVLAASVMLTQFLSLSCGDGCKRYNDYELDKTFDVSAGILSDGFMYSWPDQLTSARAAYHPEASDELLYLDVAFHQTDCEDAFLAINFLVRGDDTQAEVVSVYLNNSDCDGYVGEMSEMEIRHSNCPITFEWTEAPVVIDNIHGTMAVTFTACNIEIDNSGISGEPIVSSVTLDGLYTSEMTRTYCH